ncbi:ribonuclease H-like domain-containing protein [Usnea florida]
MLSLEVIRLTQGFTIVRVPLLHGATQLCHPSSSSCHVILPHLRPEATFITAMDTAANASTQLQPLSVMLSALHLPPPISALHNLAGIEVSLPISDIASPIRFKAIVSECTSHNLLLKSFYDANVRGKIFDGIEYVLSPMPTLGISRCAFTTPFSMMTGESRLNDQIAPQFGVDGISHIPFTHQGYHFSPQFLICDHIFCRQEYETQFVAVLGLGFLREYFIRAQSSEKGWMIQLPAPCLVHISELPIFTNGCCLNNGNAAQDPETKSVLGGYGIHFPTLPIGWDMYSALASDGPHTNQKAGLTAIIKAELTAVVRALQTVRLRKVPCDEISIFTDSEYAVQGLNDWIPNICRSNGYLDARKRPVVNADLFRSLDEEVSLLMKTGVSVTLNHVPREQNQKADALSKRGAVSGVPLMTFSIPHKGSSNEGRDEARENPKKDGKGRGPPKAKGGNGVEGRPDVILGKKAVEKRKPLVQWTPDGEYWVEWQSVSSSGETIEMKVV